MESITNLRLYCLMWHNIPSFPLYLYITAFIYIYICSDWHYPSYMVHTVLSMFCDLQSNTALFDSIFGRHPILSQHVCMFVLWTCSSWHPNVCPVFVVIVFTRNTNLGFTVLLYIFADWWRGLRPVSWQQVERPCLKRPRLQLWCFALHSALFSPESKIMVFSHLVLTSRFAGALALKSRIVRCMAVHVEVSFVAWKFVSMLPKAGA